MTKRSAVLRVKFSLDSRKSRPPANVTPSKAEFQEALRELDSFIRLAIHDPNRGVHTRRLADRLAAELRALRVSLGDL